MKWLAAAALTLIATAAVAQQKKPDPAPKGGGGDEKTFYAIGVSIAKSLKVFAPRPGELDRVIAGLRDGIAGKAPAEVEKMQPQIEELAQKRRKQQSAAYLEKMAKQKGAAKTASGAIVLLEKEGDGEHPTAADKVKVQYTGKLIDGQVFDSSVQRGQPAEFLLSGVIKCWTEGVQKMRVGGKAKIVCPSDIAYGERGRPPQIPGDAVLTFDIELLGIVKQ